MVTRRDALKLSLGAGLSLALPGALFAATPTPLLTRPIPSSGQRLPVIGLGSSATFASTARDDASALDEVLRTLVDQGGAVFDTAPSYGASEEVAGKAVQDLGIADRVFWATKVNVAGREADAKADPAAARAQIEASFARLGRDTIDLIQVHNLGDVPTQLGILKELKEAKRVRYRRHLDQQAGVSEADRDDAQRAAGFHRRGLRDRQPRRRGDDSAAGRRTRHRRAGVRAVRTHAPVGTRR